MGTLKLNTTSGGSVSIQAADGASDNTVTLPAVSGANIITSADSGTVTQGMIGSGVAPTGPIFSAYLSSAQSVADSTWTKIQADTEEFDTESCYDNTTNYRFTPTVAGYYQVNGQAIFSGSTGRVSVAVYKNGSQAKEGCMPSNFGGSTTIMSAAVSTLIYLNGTTDYIELYGWQNGGNSEFFTGASGFGCYFQAVLARAA